jgi:hypothetical protein
MKTQSELRAFVWGTVFGIVAVIGSFVIASELLGIKLQPIIG